MLLPADLTRLEADPLRQAADRLHQEDPTKGDPLPGEPLPAALLPPEVRQRRGAVQLQVQAW